MSKILIVDDSAMVRRQISQLLIDAGYDVVQAFDGVDALEKMEATQDLALVLCDVNMPRLNGIGLLEKVSQNEDLKKIPFVMVTTEGSVTLIREAKQAGAKGWIIKPFKDETIISVSRRIVGPAPNAAAGEAQANA